MSLSATEEIVPDGLYAVQPTMEQKSKTVTPPPQWLTPAVTMVNDNTAKILNGSNTPLEVKRNDNVAEAFPMVDPDTLEPLKPEEVPAIAKDDLTWKDVTIDPDRTLSQATRDSFRTINQDFQTVFKPDLPKYNGIFGRLEAVINVPDTMPASARMKEVPWYPRKRLLELQEKFDELDRKGAIVRPQDARVEVVHVSPSFLVAKKPPSKGFRLVTAFGHLAQHMRTPPTPITSTDQVLRRLSSWKYLIKTDIAQAYHQIPLAKSSMPYAGVSTLFKGVRVYTTAAMGMPGSEVALQELTALLFGDLRRQGAVEALMDDI